MVLDQLGVVNHRLQSEGNAIDRNRRIGEGTCDQADRGMVRLESSNWRRAIGLNEEINGGGMIGGDAIRGIGAGLAIDRNRRIGRDLQLIAIGGGCDQSHQGFERLVNRDIREIFCD